MIVYMIFLARRIVIERRSERGAVKHSTGNEQYGLDTHDNIQMHVNLE